MSSSIATLLREPLIQFLVLGLLIFAAEQWATGQRNDPHHILVGDAQYEELRQIFVEGQGRDPSASEMKKLIIKWAENEILYREALSMGLDQGDDMIRNRVILKLRDILFNNAIVENPTDSELTSFFEFNRSRYDTPERYDVEQFSVDDVETLAQAQALAQQLNQSGVLPQPYEPVLRRYQQRPASNLATLFGVDVLQQLVQVPSGQWLALEQAGRLRLARITHHYPAEPVALADVHALVVRDWKKFRYDIQLADQTKAIADRYSIAMELSPALAEKMRLSISDADLKRLPLSPPAAPARAAMN